MMRSPLVVGIAGRTCAGKDTLVGELIQRLQPNRSCEHVRFSDGLADMITAVAADKSVENYSTLTAVLKSLIGDEVLSHIVQRRTILSASDIVFWNGVRTQSDVDALRSFQRSILVFVDVTDQLAFDRFRKRGRNARDSSVVSVEAFSDSLASVEDGLPQIRPQSDLLLDGNQTIEKSVLDAAQFLIEFRCEQTVSA